MYLTLTKAQSFQVVDETGRQIACKKGQTIDIDDSTGQRLLNLGIFSRGTVPPKPAQRAPRPSQAPPQAQEPLRNKLPSSLKEVQLLLVCAGGVGDILLTTPIIRHLKAMDPTVLLDYTTQEVMRPLLEGNEHLRALVSRDDAKKNLRRYAAILNFTGGLSQNPNAYKDHCTQSLAGWVGIPTPVDGLATDLVVPATAEQWAERRLVENGVVGDKVVAIATDASADHKTWPWRQASGLAKSLLSEGLAVMLLGKKPTSPPLPKTPRLLDFAGQTTLLQAMALVSQATVFVGPDSGLLHVADALRRPAIGLFGPFPPQLSVIPGGTVVPVTPAQVDCSPCLHFKNSECNTRKGKDSACMLDISTADVFQRAMRMLH